MFICYKYFSHVRSVMADIIWIITVQWASLWMDHSPKILMARGYWSLGERPKMDGPNVEMSSRPYLESGRTVWVVFLVSVLHIMGNGPPSGALMWMRAQCMNMLGRHVGVSEYKPWFFMKNTYF